MVNALKPSDGNLFIYSGINFYVNNIYVITFTYEQCNFETLAKINSYRFFYICKHCK